MAVTRTEPAEPRSVVVHPRLTVSQPGFRSYEQTGIVLEVNQRAYLEVKLEVGSASDRIEVSAEAPLITT